MYLILCFELLELLVLGHRVRTPLLASGWIALLRDHFGLFSRSKFELILRCSGRTYITLSRLIWLDLFFLPRRVLLRSIGVIPLRLVISYEDVSRKKMSKNDTGFFTYRSATSVAAAGNRTHRSPRTAGSPCCCTRPSWSAVAAAVASSAVGESG